jgi:UDP-glucuronate 4-epimerase
VDSNINGFLQVIEGCRRNGVEHLVYASTSSVYGANTHMPFSERQCVDHPLTLYAATKKANELMAHSYSSLYGLATTGLRFFTVYGPWGRPDMALFRFTKNILAGKPIDVYYEGQHQRDFTYIDDVVRGVVATVDHPAKPDPEWNSDEPDPGSSRAPYKIYNIGNQRPVTLLRFIEVLERCLGLTAIKNLLPMQLGDVPDTAADVAALAQDVGYRPSTELEEGVARFVEWYLEYYRPMQS